MTNICKPMFYWIEQNEMKGETKQYFYGTIATNDTSFNESFITHTQWNG